MPVHENKLVQAVDGVVNTNVTLGDVFTDSN